MVADREVDYCFLFHQNYPQFSPVLIPRNRTVGQFHIMVTETLSTDAVYIHVHVYSYICVQSQIHTYYSGTEAHYSSPIALVHDSFIYTVFCTVYRGSISILI